MAEYVGLGVQPPNTIAKLSQILDLRQQRAVTEGAEQTQRQRAALASYDFGKHVGEDGTVDLNSLTTDPELRAAAGDQYLEVLQHAATAKQQQLEAKSKLFNLRGQQVEGLAKMLDPLLADSDVVQDNEKGRQKVNEAWMQYGQLHGDEALPVLKAYAAPLRNAPPGKMEQALRMIQMQALDVEKQRSAQLPELVNTGSALKNVNPNAAVASRGDIPLTLSPEAQLPRMMTNAAGQTIAVNPQAPSQAIPVGTSPLNPTTAEASVRNAAAAGVSARVQHAQEAANNTIQAQDALSRARSILDLADPNTGSTFETKRKISNFLASVGIDTKGADDANSLVKNLARYEAARATQAGLGGTDAARELAHTGSPNVSIDPAALKGIVTQSLATEKALATYANIQAKASDPATLSKNEADFRSIPNLIEGYEYGLARNKEEADAFLKKHGLSAAEMRKTREKIKEFEARR